MAHTTLSDGPSTCAAIRAASTQDGVISAVREYLSSLRADELALLPATLSSVGVNHVQEVIQAGLELTRRETLAAFDAPEAVVLKQAATVFSTAAMRLALLSLG